MRRTKLFATLMLCLCLVWATGCASSSSNDNAGDARSTDAAEAEGDATADLETHDPLDGITADSRVVALSRSLGDMWLLAGGQLVGITEDGMTLPDLTEGAESVGPVTDPDEQSVIELNPDLVLLTQDLSAHQEIQEHLTQAGVNALMVDVNSFDDYAQMMATFTQLTGRDDLYEKNVTNVQAQIDNIKQNTVVNDENSYLVLRVAPSTDEVLGTDSFVCNMLDDMGLTNVAPDGSVLGEPTVEDIAQLNPDRIFLVFQGDEQEAKEAYEERFELDPGWSELAAVQNARVVVLPKTLFQYKPNAKWGEAYSYLSQSLHGSWA